MSEDFEKILSTKRKRESKLKAFKEIIFALDKEGYSRARICEILAENYPDQEEFFTLSRLTSFMVSPRNHVQMSKKEATEILAVLKFDAERKGIERQSYPPARKYHDEIILLVEQGYSRSIIAEYLNKKYGENFTYGQINFYVSRYIQNKNSSPKKESGEKTRSPSVSYKSFRNEIFEYVNAGFSVEDTLTALKEAHPEENFTLANLRAYIKRTKEKEQKSLGANAQVNNTIHGKAIEANNSTSDSVEQAKKNSVGGNAFGGLSQETTKV